jgi:hypothetical protein
VSSTVPTEPEANVSREPTSCSCFPLGYYVVIPILLSTIGWSVSLIMDGCEYARLTGPTVAELTNDPSVPFIEVGFYWYRVPMQGDDGEWAVNRSDLCEKYDRDVVDVDGVWSFAVISRDFGVLLGGAGAVFLWFSCCFSYSKTTLRWAGYVLLLATVMLLLAFSWFGTSMCHGDGDKCTLGYGSTTDILTLIFWVVSTVLIFARFPSPRRTNVEHTGKRSAPSVSMELEISKPSVNRQRPMQQEDEEQQQQQVSTDALDSNCPNIPEIS